MKKDTYQLINKKKDRKYRQSTSILPEVVVPSNHPPPLRVFVYPVKSKKLCLWYLIIMMKGCMSANGRAQTAHPHCIHVVLYMNPELALCFAYIKLATFTSERPHSLTVDKMSRPEHTPIREDHIPASLDIMKIGTFPT